MTGPLVVMGWDPGAVTAYAMLEIDGGSARWIYGGSIRTTDSPETVYYVGGARLVAVESVTTVYPRARFVAHMATCLAHASRVAGEIAGAARARGIETVDVSAEQWRKALCGRAQAPDALIKRALMARIDGLPARTNCHERDACGVALYAGMRAGLERRV